MVNGGPRRSFPRKAAARPTTPTGRLIQYRGLTQYESELRTELAKCEARIGTITDASARRITERTITDIRAALA
jgi:hypothetical protein